MKKLIILIIIILGLSLESCGSSCGRTRRYWRNHRCVQTTVKPCLPRETTNSDFNKTSIGVAHQSDVYQMQARRGVKG